MWRVVFFALSWDLALAAAYNNFPRSTDGLGRRQYQVRHGACSYTFLLPEADNCRPPAGPYVSNAVQRDAPLDYDDSVQRLQALESIMENNTQWLMKVGAARPWQRRCGSAPAPGAGDSRGGAAVDAWQ